MIADDYSDDGWPAPAARASPTAWAKLIWLWHAHLAR